MNEPAPDQPEPASVEGSADAPTGRAATGGEHPDELKAELARLRARIAELEAAEPRGRGADREAPAAGGDAHRASQHYLLSLINHAPSLIFIKDLDHRYAVVNQRVASYVQLTPDLMVGRSEADLFPPDVAAKLIAEEKQVIESGSPLEYEEELSTPVGRRHFYTVKFPIYDAGGVLLGVGAFISDISDLKRMEAERIALKEQVIKAQQAALRELSTPLVPLAAGILAMPLVGTIDSVRAHEILESLLNGISEQHAHTAILDITGVRLVDTQVANALVKTARAARLLGARVVLTGVSPAVAQTLVHLEARLEGIVTLGTLASGISYALNAQKPQKPGASAQNQQKPATSAPTPR